VAAALISQAAMCADGLRFLPGSVTVTSVAGTFWNAERESVATGFHTVPLPESPALFPRYHHHHYIGNAEGDTFDATTNLLMEVRPRCM
jgi:hypothetical protein